MTYRPALVPKPYPLNPEVSGKAHITNPWTEIMIAQGFGVRFDSPKYKQSGVPCTSKSWQHDGNARSASGA